MLTKASNLTKNDWLVITLSLQTPWTPHEGWVWESLVGFRYYKMPVRITHRSENHTVQTLHSQRRWLCSSTKNNQSNFFPWSLLYFLEQTSYPTSTSKKTWPSLLSVSLVEAHWSKSSQYQTDLLHSKLSSCLKHNSNPRRNHVPRKQVCAWHRRTIRHRLEWQAMAPFVTHNASGIGHERRDVCNNRASVGI